MKAPLRFGIMTLHTVPWSVLAECWRILDASAFDSAWVGDHLTLARMATTPLLEGWTVLPALATLDWLNDEAIPAVRADRGEARAVLTVLWTGKEGSCVRVTERGAGSALIRGCVERRRPGRGR